MNDPNTYIETDSLRAWGVQMTQLNNEALDIMDSIEKEVKILNDYWKGKAASGFDKVTSNLIADGRNYHNNMKDIEKMLNEIVNTAENQ